MLAARPEFRVGHDHGDTHVQVSARRQQALAAAMQHAHAELTAREARVLTARDLRTLAATTLPAVPADVMDAVLCALPADPDPDPCGSPPPAAPQVDTPEPPGCTLEAVGDVPAATYSMPACVPQEAFRIKGRRVAVGASVKHWWNVGVEGAERQAAVPPTTTTEPPVEVGQV